MMFIYGVLVMMLLSYFGSWFAQAKLEAYTFERFTLIESITIGLLSWIGVFFIVGLAILITCVYLLERLQDAKTTTR